MKLVDVQLGRFLVRKVVDRVVDLLIPCFSLLIALPIASDLLHQ
jgi:hypothetical protein